MRRLCRRALLDFQVIRPTWQPIRERTTKLTALFVCLSMSAWGQQTYTWEQIREKFREKCGCPLSSVTYVLS